MPRFSDIFLIVLLSAIGLALAFLLFMTVQTFAHMAATGWPYYPARCSDRDCAPIDSAEVRITGEGYHVRGQFLPHGNPRIRISGDNEYHLCQLPRSQTVLCLYIPPAGV